jgi:hypothetical protein
MLELLILHLNTPQSFEQAFDPHDCLLLPIVGPLKSFDKQR